MEMIQDINKLSPEECAGVAVFAEQRGGKLSGVVLEILGEGRRLADALGQPLCAILVGNGVSTLVEELQHYKVDKVFAIDNEALANFQDETYATAVSAVVAEVKPAILLAGMTNIGRSFLPSVAVKFGTSITTGCTGLSINDAKNLVATRPAFGATVFADVVSETARPQIATIRRKAYEVAERQDTTTGEVVAIAMPGAAPKTTFLESVDELAGAIDLTEADVIISGGRGIGGPESFAMLRELADAMGGVVGASRAAVDAGWIAYSHQVGQTGKTVKPKIYVACGISGAIQHLVGMRTASTIIAINRDPEAPIFKVATYGLVGDVKQIVPALTERFKQG